MTLPADIDALSLIAKLVVVAGLCVTGIALLMRAYLAQNSTCVVGSRGVASRPARRALPVVGLSAPRLGPGSELSRLASVMDNARVRLDTITISQRTAARHLDSAEIALNRLLLDIADVMPVVIGPTIVPRRIAGLGLVAKAALAA